jgi:sulfide:quinone oxidoreductase
MAVKPIAKPGGTARVVIIGGGVAGLEAMLALRALAEERVSIDMVTPQREFVYRPLSVLEPFGGKMPRFDLAEMILEQRARHHPDAVTEVDTGKRLVRTQQGKELPYDALVVAMGARARDTIPGALTFGSDVSGETFSVLIDEIEQGAVKHVVFALPGGVAWSLPLYELVLNTAARVEARGVGKIELTLVTPEDEPLSVFGRPAAEAVRKLLDEAGVRLVTNTYPQEVESDRMRVLPDGYIEADRVVALPRLEGLPMPGLPQDESGFVPVDEHGLVRGTEDVYAAGDMTTFPVKQGGIAAAQADAVAEVIAARAGAPVDPQPFRPVLRGLLLTGDGEGRRFLSTHITRWPAAQPRVELDALWWPPSKVFGRYLAPYLARRGLAEEQVPQPADAEVAFEIRLNS